MKNVLRSFLLMALLTACGQGSVSGGQAAPGSAQPYSAGCSLPICANDWKGPEGAGGYIVFRVSDSSVTSSSICKNGMIAKVTVPAKVTATHIEVLQSAQKREVRSDGQWCEVNAVAVAIPYMIQNNQLLIEGAVAVPYNN